MKSGSASITGLRMGGRLNLSNLNPGQQGRVLENQVAGYKIPSLSGKKARQYWKDMLVQISEVTVGDDQPVSNGNFETPSGRHLFVPVGTQEVFENYGTTVDVIP